MDAFEQAFEHLKQWEGGYADVEGDRGGETYIGISRVFHPNWNGWDIVDAYKLKYGYLRHNQKLESEELERQVKSFYRINYWDAIRLGEIRHKELAKLVFDSFVHSGGRGVKLLQQSVNELRKADNRADFITVDGVIGDNTLWAVNDLPGNRLYNRMKYNRKVFLMNLCAEESMKKFFKGFMARIDAFPDLPEQAA